MSYLELKKWYQKNELETKCINYCEDYLKNYEKEDPEEFESLFNIQKDFTKIDKQIHSVSYSVNLSNDEEYYTVKVKCLKSYDLICEYSIMFDVNGEPLDDYIL